MKKELAAKNPLRLIDLDQESKRVIKRMGLVMARAGLGKTALLVQIALDNLLNNRQIVHVGINHDFEKIKIWYDDIFKNLTKVCPMVKEGRAIEAIMRNRMIMTFKEMSFSPATLKERLNDLISQDIFQPCCVVVDGFDYAMADRKEISDLRQITETMNLQIWFSAVAHRNDQRVSDTGVPAPCHEVDDLFDTIILLQPETDKKIIGLNIIKNANNPNGCGQSLAMDPATFLVMAD